MRVIIAGVLLAACSALAAAESASIYESPASLASENPIDKAVFGRLRELQIQPARLCSDSVFVRRAYLDIIGTLPKGTEAQQFLLDSNPNKRRVLIDRLVERDEFAD